MAKFKVRSWGSDTPSLSGTLWKLGVLGVVDAVATTMIMVLLGQGRIWVAALTNGAAQGGGRACDRSADVLDAAMVDAVGVRDPVWQEPG
jgi:hypothetical protein